MKTTKALFFELMYDFRSERWNEFELPKLSLRELLGGPFVRQQRNSIVRLLSQPELRLKLARFIADSRLCQQDRKPLLHILDTGKERIFNPDSSRSRLCSDVLRRVPLTGRSAEERCFAL
jgi:hypothetical protein